MASGLLFRAHPRANCDVARLAQKGPKGWLAAINGCTTVPRMPLFPAESRRTPAFVIRDMSRTLSIPVMALVLLLGTSFCGPVVAAASPRLPAQTAAKAPEAAFGVLAAQITGDRTEGGAESVVLEEQALEILDRAALEQLNGGQPGGSAGPNLDQVNQRLAAFVTHQPPVGEAYRAVRLAGNPAAYVLIADFGLSGPSAIRLYAGAPGELALVARIDRATQKDFVDDYMELVPLPGPAAVFVTAAGRTDDLQTGIFTAWYFDGHAISAVWTSDILERSSYEAAADGFFFIYFSESY